MKKQPLVFILLVILISSAVCYNLNGLISNYSEHNKFILLLSIIFGPWVFIVF